jgi:hypothetical protein
MMPLYRATCGGFAKSMLSSGVVKEGIRLPIHRNTGSEALHGLSSVDPRDTHTQARHSYLKTQSGGETSLNWGQKGKSALAAGEGAVNHVWALIGRVEKSQGEKGCGGQVDVIQI